MEFRDGVHGLITWGLAVVLTAFFGLAAAGVAGATATQVSPTGQQVTGEPIIATELDNLYRTDRNVPNLNYRRAEATRILLKASSTRGVPSDDRDYLAEVVANNAGISQDAARDRVDHAVADAKRDIHQARVSVVLQALFIAVALMVGAAVAWFSACEGGRERELGTYPIWDWSYRRR